MIVKCLLTQGVPQLQEPQEAGTRAAASPHCIMKDRRGKHQHEQTVGMPGCNLPKKSAEEASTPLCGLCYMVGSENLMQRDHRLPGIYSALTFTYKRRDFILNASQTARLVALPRVTS